MTNEKLKQTLQKYKTFFIRGHVLPVKHDNVTLATDLGMQLQHCHWMVDQMINTEKELGQLYRWLGFIQGVMWSQSICSINELQGDNRNGTTEIQVPWI